MTRLLLQRVKPSIGLRDVREKTTSSWEYCVDLVKRGDFENYLCSLLLPSETRATAFAVRAFNIEVARVADQTTDIQRGAMRIQFWRDVLDKVYLASASGEPLPGTPVAVELKKALSRREGKLSKRWLNRLIQARLERLPASKPFRNMAEVEHYGEQVASSVNYLIIESLGEAASVKADHAASHLGKAQYLSSVVRGIGPLANQGMVLLPMDVMARHGLSQEEVVRVTRGKRKDEEAEKKLREVAFEISAASHQHLQKARALCVEANLSSAAAATFLPGACVADYLKRLKTAGFNPVDKSLTIRPAWLPVQLWWKKTRGGVPVPDFS